MIRSGRASRRLSLPAGAVALPERITKATVTASRSYRHRSTMPVMEFPPVPTTGDELILRWAQRDAEYAKRPPLDPETIASIRNARMEEAGRLKNRKERAAIYLRAKTWAPPVPANFGGLRDYLE